MKIFNKKIEKRLKKASKVFSSNFGFSFNTGASVFGFVLGQFVWIWILSGFLKWFALWFNEVTKYGIENIYPVTKFFWIVYGVWFFISIMIRLSIRWEDGK